MTEPTIICPNCKTEIRLTESLAAPLITATREQFEQQLSQKDEEIAKRELELTVEKRMQEGLGDVREKAKREAEEGLKLKVMEKDQTIASMQQTIEELKQKAEQGSQQLQREIQESELENLLHAKFPFDSIDPVPKGEMIYQDLTGPRFRHRVEAIVEALSTTQEDLDKERKAIMKQSAKREEQIQRVMGTTVGMYGDLQGIAGKSLQEMEGWDLLALSPKGI